MYWHEVVKILELNFFEFTVQYLQGHTKAAMCLGEVGLEGEYASISQKKGQLYPQCANFEDKVMKDRILLG